MQENTFLESWVLVAVFPGSSYANACCCLTMAHLRSSWCEDDWTVDFDSEEEAMRIEREYGLFAKARKLGATDCFAFKCSRPKVSRETSPPSTLPPAPSDSAGFPVVNDKE